MSQRSYRNCKVTLDVERDNDTRDMHRIVAQWDLDGRTTGPVVSDIRLEDVQAKLSPVRQRLAEMRRRPEEAELERQDLGGDLFKAMMPSVPIQTEVLRYLRGVLFREGKRTGDGVRISVQCLTDALEATPWELASVPFLDAGRFAPIVLEDGVSVVRLGRPDDDPPPVGPLGSLRVFFVDAGKALSENFALLSGQSLKQSGLPRSCIVSKQPEPVGEVLWSWVTGGLERAGQDDPVDRPNVFHFTGHGERGEAGRDPCLLFSARGGGETRVGAQDLAAAILNAGAQLAVIAACDAGSDDFWSGMGATLLHYRVPAVVTMQAPLYDGPGDDFACKLYEGLLAGQLVDDAMAAARRAIRDGPDWWVPILHTRSIDFRFDRLPAPTAAPARVAGTPSRRHEMAADAIPVCSVGSGTAGASSVTPWRPANPPARDICACVLSSDGAACAATGTDGTIWVGVVSANGPVHWWEPLVAGRGAKATAVHVHQCGAELLVRGASGTRVIMADHRGRSVTVREDIGTALSGAWTGHGFTWVDGLEVVHSDDDSAERVWLPKEGCRLLDAAIFGDRISVGWVDKEYLWVAYGPLGAPERAQVRRSGRLDEAPDRVVLARAAPWLGEGPLPGRGAWAPADSYTGKGEELLGWAWDDLTGYFNGP